MEQSLAMGAILADYRVSEICEGLLRHRQLECVHHVEDTAGGGYSRRRIQQVEDTAGEGYSRWTRTRTVAIQF